MPANCPCMCCTGLYQLPVMTCNGPELVNISTASNFHGEVRQMDSLRLDL